MKLYFEVVAARHDAITLPIIAVMQDDSGSYVYANANNTAQRFCVTTGGEQGAHENRRGIEWRRGDYYNGTAVC